MTARKVPPRKAPPRKTTKKTPRVASAARQAERLDQLEHQLNTVIWLHAELAYALKRAAAQQMAAKMTPQIQQAIMQKIMNGAQ